MAFENSSREFTFRRKIITFRASSRGFTYDLLRPVLLRVVEEEGGTERNVVLYERVYSSDTPLFLQRSSTQFHRASITRNYPEQSGRIGKITGDVGDVLIRDK